MFFIRACFFYNFLETRKIKPWFVSVTLHCFLHSLRCSRAVSLTRSCYFALYDIVG